VDAVRGDATAGAHRLDPFRVAVVGHSLGGFAALMTAAADPRVGAVASIAGFDFGAAAAACQDPAVRAGYVEAFDDDLLPLRDTSGEALVREIASQPTKDSISSAAADPTAGQPFGANGCQLRAARAALSRSVPSRAGGRCRWTTSHRAGTIARHAGYPRPLGGQGVRAQQGVQQVVDRVPGELAGHGPGHPVVDVLEDRPDAVADGTLPARLMRVHCEDGARLDHGVHVGERDAGGRPAQRPAAAGAEVRGDQAGVAQGPECPAYGDRVAVQARGDLVAGQPGVAVPPGQREPAQGMHRHGETTVAGHDSAPSVSHNE
jgi:hypothetical protein